MAKITFGGVVADARNKLGDVVYSRNRGGSFARAYVLLNSSNTPAQAAARAAFAAIQNRYLYTLSHGQREQWEKFALDAPPRPKPISPAHRTGHNWYSTLNFPLYRWLSTFLDTPPADLSSKQSSGFSAAAMDTEAHTLTIGANDSPDTDTLITIWATPPLSPATFQINHRLVKLAAIANGDTNPGDFWTEYTDLFGTPPDGARIGLMLRALNITNGTYEPGYSTTITATGTGDAMLQINKTITTAQLLDLYDNPIQLVPAPGAGKAIVPIAICLSTRGGTTPYVVAGANLNVYTDDPTTGDSHFHASIQDPLANTPDQTWMLGRIIQATLPDIPADFDNLPLNFGNASATNPTTGDADLLITLFYAIATIA